MPALGWYFLKYYQSRNDIFYHFSAHIGQAEAAALEFIGQLFVVEPELVQHRGLEIMYVNRVFYDVIAEIVRFTIHDAGLDAAACHPDGEAARVMIAPV